MSGLNKVILIGNIGKDPEVRYLESGVAIAKFPLATNDSYKNKDGSKVDQTEWHNIVVWRKTAEFAEKYLKKGSLVCVEGKIKTRSWEDKDGNKKYITEIIGDSLTILGRKGSDSPGADVSVESAEPSMPSAPDAPTDDLPF